MYSLPFHSLALAATLLLGTNARTQEKDKPVKDTPKDTFESVIKAQLKVMNDLCDVLETAKDEASGDKAIEKLKPFAKLQQDLGARMTKLGKPGPDEEEALKK